VLPVELARTGKVDGADLSAPGGTPPQFGKESKMKIKSKKGFYFYIELVLAILLVTIIWTQFPVSQQSYLDLAEQENLKYLGYTSLKALDLTEILPKFINETNFASSNFTNLDIYIKNILPTTVLAVPEYILNETTCYNASGSIGKCGVNTTFSDTTTIVYTFSNITDLISIKLYLKRTFGGHS